MTRFALRSAERSAVSWRLINRPQQVEIVPQSRMSFLVLDRIFGLLYTTRFDNRKDGHPDKVQTNNGQSDQRLSVG